MFASLNSNGFQKSSTTQFFGDKIQSEEKSCNIVDIWNSLFVEPTMAHNNEKFEIIESNPENKITKHSKKSKVRRYKHGEL